MKQLGLCAVFLMAAWFVLDFCLSVSFAGNLSFLSFLYVDASFLWCFVLTWLLLFLPKPWGRWAAIGVWLVIVLLFLTQEVYLHMFSVPFSVFNLQFVGEATHFATLGFKYISVWALISILLSGSCVFWGVKYWPQASNIQFFFLKWAFLGILGIGVLSVSFYIERGPSLGSLQQFFKPHARLVYDNFFPQRKENFVLTGFYHYTFRDILSLLTKTDNNQEQLDFLRDQQALFDASLKNNQYTGLFKGKNLILILLESGDFFAVNKDNTPVLDKLRREGIDFSNHFSNISGGAGPTFNAEFTVNTGFSFPLSTRLTLNKLSSNYFPFGLPRLFTKQGYSANSLHMGSGSFYNRTNIHLAEGYQHYYGLRDMGFLYADVRFDTFLLKNKEIANLIIPEKSPFMSFIITYTGHAPYILKENCEALLDKTIIQEIKKGVQDENTVCLKAQLAETDKMMDLLLKELEKRQLLNDTVIVVFTDHYAYGYPNQQTLMKNRGLTSPQLLHRTPFFIWAKGVTPKQVKEVTQTIDIYPTLVNLFGLKEPGMFYVGKDALASENKSRVVFDDLSSYDGHKLYPFKAGQMTQDTLTAVDAHKLRSRINDSVLENDYFRHR